MYPERRRLDYEFCDAMKLNHWLAISISLNAVLLGAAFLAPRYKQGQRVRQPAAVNHALVTPKSDAGGSHTPPSALNAFHGSRLESEDYRLYAANLRGIGCPEATIRDIITADVDDLYSRR